MFEFTPVTISFLSINVLGLIFWIYRDCLHIFWKRWRTKKKREKLQKNIEVWSVHRECRQGVVNFQPRGGSINYSVMRFNIHNAESTIDDSDENIIRSQVKDVVAGDGFIKLDFFFDTKITKGIIISDLSITYSKKTFKNWNVKAVSDDIINNIKTGIEIIKYHPQLERLEELQKKGLGN